MAQLGEAHKLYVWVEVDHHGDEGIITASLPGTDLVAPMVTTREHIARSPGWRKVAQLHAQHYAHTVRLVSFSREAMLDFIVP